jgi:hypothetical protein
MRANPVVYCSFIVRVQSEYSVAAQTVITRCLLETPANGERCGFTDIDALLAALRTELMVMQGRIISCQQENQKG